MLDFKMKSVSIFDFLYYEVFLTFCIMKHFEDLSK